MNEFKFGRLMQWSEYQMILAMMEMRYDMSPSRLGMIRTRRITNKKFTLLHKTTNNMKGSELLMYQLFLAPFLPDWIMSITPILSVFMEYSSSLQSHVATSLNKLTLCSILFQPKQQRLISYYMRRSILSMAPRIFQQRVESQTVDTKKMLQQIMKGAKNHPLSRGYFLELNRKRKEFFKVKNANLQSQLDNKAKKHMRYRQSLGSNEPTTRPKKAERERKYRRLQR